MSAWDGIERRRFVRVKLHFTASITDSQGVTISTYAEEISQKGVKVSIKRELKRSTDVELEIYLRREPLVCKGKVAWVRKIEGEYLEGGVVFDTGIELYDLSQEDKKLIKTIILQKKEESK
jgi:hypothetical protein